MSVPTTEALIRDVARRQHGVVTRAQLMDAGLSRWVVKRRLAAGRLRRLHAGVYLVGPIEPPRAAAMAAVLAGGPGAVLSHFSAAELWSLRPEAPPDPPRAGTIVDITVPGADRGRRPGVRAHRAAALAPVERTEVEGVPVTTAARTLLDLAGEVGSGELERMVARARRAELTDRSEWPALLSRHRGRRGVAVLRSILSTPGGPALTRSEAESRFLELVRGAGLSVPASNIRIGRYEVDFLWARERLAVEVDGFRYHRSRQRFETDRRKDAWLLGRGVTVLRLSWRQITGEPLATAAVVGQALARSRG
ncbi:MAG: DUF559 domain-containing protein [Longimicrobiales bacterium]